MSLAVAASREDWRYHGTVEAFAVRFVPTARDAVPRWVEWVCVDVLFNAPTIFPETSPNFGAFDCEIVAGCFAILAIKFCEERVCFAFAKPSSMTTGELEAVKTSCLEARDPLVGAVFVSERYCIGCV